MSGVESFVRLCESEFGTAVMDREAAYIERFLDPGDRILDVGAGIGSVEEAAFETDDPTEAALLAIAGSPFPARP